MNNINPMEAAGNPEQRIREELLAGIVAESEGTVALYMSADLTDEQKTQMYQSQSERSGAPADRLTKSQGGWGDYGEREAVNRVTRLNGEQVSFVPMEDGNVDVRYAFSQPGYKDDTGRPGNVLNVQFIVSPERAHNINDVLQADPSFIQDIVERQVASIGIDTAGPEWQRKWKPHYYENFVKSVQDKDRVLRVQAETPEGEIIDSQSLTYGENKSLLSMVPPQEEAIQTPEFEESYYPVESSAQAELDIPDESYEELFATEYAETKQGILAELAAGADIYELEDYYAQSSAEYEELLSGDLSPEDRAQFMAYRAVDEKILSDLEEIREKRDSENSAQADVESAYRESHSIENGSHVMLEGKPVTVVEKYDLANGTPYVVVRDADNNERHVRADSIST